MLKHSFVAAAILLGLGGTAALAAPPPAKAPAAQGPATAAEGAHAATARQADHKTDWKADKKADGQRHMNAQKPEAPAHP